MPGNTPNTKIVAARTERVADIVAIASIDRLEHAPDDVHPRSVYGHTQSVVVIGYGMLRGAFTSTKEGNPGRHDKRLRPAG